jgi:integrase
LVLLADPAAQERTPMAEPISHGRWPLSEKKARRQIVIALPKAAGVRPIKFHGLRHTSATLLLAAAVPSKVVQEPLDHKKISTTLDVYAHVLPSMQRDATRRLAALLHRR